MIEDTVDLDNNRQYDPTAETTLTPQEITLLRLRTNGPRDTLTVRYLARNATNTLVCVTRDPLTGRTRFFTGKGSPLREVEVLQEDVYRDGGTTYITTAEGEFYAPRPGRDVAAARYADEQFTLMDTRDLDGHPTPAGLILH